MTPLPVTMMIWLAVSLAAFLKTKPNQIKQTLRSPLKLLSQLLPIH